MVRNRDADIRLVGPAARPGDDSTPGPRRAIRAPLSLSGGARPADELVTDRGPARRAASARGGALSPHRTQILGGAATGACRGTAGDAAQRSRVRAGHLGAAGPRDP